MSDDKKTWPLTADAVDDIVVSIGRYVEDILGVKTLDDDAVYGPFTDHIRELLEQFSNGDRNWN